MDIWLSKIKKNKIWKFNRYIINKNLQNEIIKGEVEWILIKPNIYKYVETGLFNGYSFTQKYIYDFTNKAVYFDDYRLFFKFPKQNIIAKHFCNNDLYKIEVGIDFIKFNVEGPNKAYQSSTVFY